jgi:hypothetical protein
MPVWPARFVLDVLDASLPMPMTGGPSGMNGGRVEGGGPGRWARDTRWRPGWSRPRAAPRSTSGRPGRRGAEWPRAWLHKLGGLLGQGHATHQIGCPLLRRQSRIQISRMLGTLSGRGLRNETEEQAAGDGDDPCHNVRDAFLHVDSPGKGGYDCKTPLRNGTWSAEKEVFGRLRAQCKPTRANIELLYPAFTNAYGIFRQEKSLPIKFGRVYLLWIRSNRALASVNRQPVGTPVFFVDLPLLRRSHREPIDIDTEGSYRDC